LSNHYKMSMGIHSKQIIIRHAAIWICIMFNFIFLTSISGSLVSSVVWVLMLLFNFSFSYYALLLYIWPNYFENGKFQSLFLFLLLILFFNVVYITLIEIIVPYFGGKTFLQGKPLDVMIPKFLVNFSYITFASLGSYFNWLGIKKAEEAEKIDQNAIELELMILKNQFHSHLTFNFLNFCYNKIRRLSAEAANSIEEFSFMLRYSLKGGAEELICLREEVEYIENYISFQKCLTNDLHVEFIYEGELSNTYILPRIFSIFIENSFKHGILHDFQNPVIIHIKSFQGEVYFNIKNQKSNSKGFIESGIGLKNVKQILQLFYPCNHLLKITDMGNIFTCNLIIKT
jgi:two-component system LytT family sensor kinase